MKGQKGFAFITVLTLMTLIFGMAISYVDLLMSERRLLQGSDNSQRAEAIAEAGLEEAYWEYNYGGADFTGWTSINGGTGVRKTDAAFTDASGTTVGTYTTEIANYDSANAVVTVSAQLLNRNGGAITAAVASRSEPRPLFSAAIQSNDPVHFDSNSTTNSYDSSIGNYGGANIAYNGDVVTNSGAVPAISLDSNAYIYGDAATGSGGSVTPTSRVIGGTSANASLTMPDNETLYEDEINAALALADSGIMNSATVLNGSARYQRINLPSNSSLTVNAAGVILYLTETGTAIDMDSNCDLIINPGCSITIITSGEVQIDSNANLNWNGSNSTGTANFTLVGLSTCTSIAFDSNVDMVGTINAPSANVQLDSNVDIYGAVLGDDVDLDSNVHIHYDENLEDNGPSNGTRLQWVRRTS